MHLKENKKFLDILTLEDPTDFDGELNRRAIYILNLDWKHFSLADSPPVNIFATFCPFNVFCVACFLS